MMHDGEASSQRAAKNELASRARRLFEFLAQVQSINSPPVRSYVSYRNQEPGEVIVLNDLPGHSSVGTGLGQADQNLPLLSVGRTSPTEPPRPPAPEWIMGAWRSASDSPQISPELTAVSSEDQDVLDERRAIEARLRAWLEEWNGWAASEAETDEAQALYQRCFRLHTSMEQASDSSELVLGVGLLTWSTGTQTIARHVFTTPVETQIDAKSGRIDFVLSGNGLREELDMLDPEQRPPHHVIQELHEQLRQFDGYPLDEEALTGIAKSLIHRISPDGEYTTGYAVTTPRAHPVISFTPMLIQRRRTARGIENILKTIAEHIEQTGEVPAGLVSIVDPDSAPTPEPLTRPGALIQLEDSIFAPLPLNSVQERILERVNTKPQVLVQGPPGTGKTHTAAALLSHLLAQGQRVLVTAQTDRALQEVRNKLPESIRSLAVAVVGTSRSELSDLKQAVTKISERQENHDASASQAKIDRLLRTVDELRTERKKLGTQLLEVREREIQERSLFGYEGTLSAIAQQSMDDQLRYAWLESFTPKGDACPVTGRDALDWLCSIRDETFLQDSRETNLPPGIAQLPEPAVFLNLVDCAKHSGQQADYYQQQRMHPAFSTVAALNHDVRTELRHRLEYISSVTERLALLRAGWAQEALADIRAGAWRIWVERRNQVHTQIGIIEQHLAHIPPGTSIEFSGDSNQLLHLAETLTRHIAAHGDLKLSADGQPKIGLFTPAAVKQAQPLFQQARVNGRAPTTVGTLSALLGYIHCGRLFDETDRLWPASAGIPSLDSFQMRITWHRSQLDQLNQLIDFGQSLDEFSAWFAQHHLPQPNWADLPKTLELVDVVACAEASEAYELATRPLAELDSYLATSVRLGPASQAIENLRQAVKELDAQAYTSAFSRIQHLSNLRSTVERLATTEKALQEHVPGLVESVRESKSDEVWDERLGDLQGAWAWCRVRRELSAEAAYPIDSNRIQRQIQALEDQLRKIAAEVAAERAWAHAVGPDRLSGSKRQYLVQYAQLVSRLGKGTGKYADARRRDIRQVMDRCRPLVPVWIMPLYRIAEQLDVSENMFDVVLVDEASQAGIEAMFLQYLARRIVVIGDDKQVSPAAVGTNEESIRQLASRYFDPADPAKTVWQDPKRSLFDEAKARFGGQLTLPEHRRCVPEIIGFCNQVIYEPEGIHLRPVRQYGSDRLTPIQTVYCSDGYESGSTSSKINKAEAERIVSQLLACFTDPAYAGKTFGVISLLGSAQARHIENLLLNVLPPDEWAKRDLRCGDSASFQGSERDVIFLSMVTGPEDGGYARSARTRTEDIQRFNVAFSRAKDQVWLFHSVTLSQLRNEEDMRHKLLSYCLRRGGTTTSGLPKPVSEHDREVPFDSLFEQRVFNRILERGYLVEPQVETNGYRIDLVVVGGHARLAVECDGDRWHGPEQFQQDLGRQRDLERCGWTFFRIRESSFYLAPEETLKPLWDELDRLGILPFKGDDNPAAERAEDSPDPGIDPVPVEPSPVPPPQAIPDQVPASAQPLSPDGSPSMAASPRNGQICSPTQPSVAAETDHDLGERRANATVPGDRAALSPRRAAAGQRPITSRRSAAEPAHPAASRPSPKRSRAGESYPKRTTGTPKLAAYRSFSGWAPSAISRDNPQTIAALRSIVKVEGPVTGRRLKRAFLDAAGLPQDSAEHDRELNRALHAAVLTHRITAHSPLGESNLNAQTYTVGHQPATPRRLGPRRVLEIPPAELAALLDLVDDGSDHLSVCRLALAAIGAETLTRDIWEAFQQAGPLRRVRPESPVNVEADFDSAVRKACALAWSEEHYDPVRIIHEIDKHGCVEAARRLVRSPLVSHAFTSLAERGRLDLTVEHIMTQPRFRSLFHRADLDLAEDRLNAYRSGADR